MDSFLLFTCQKGQKIMLCIQYRYNTISCSAMYTYVEGVKRSSKYTVWTVILFLSKVLKEAQNTYIHTFLLITFLIFNQFSI